MTYHLPNKNQPFDYNLYKPSEIMNYDECWLNQVDESWNSCTSFNDLVKNNRAFINGNIPNTPTHLGSLEDTDTNYIQSLIKLSNMEILTICGQQYLRKQLDSQYILCQREHISLVYKPCDMLQLYDIIKKLNDSELFYYAIYSSNKDTIPMIYQTSKLDKIEFSNPEFWITRTLDVTKNTFENHTHVAEPVDIISEYSNYSYYVSDFYTNVACFEIWNPKWEDDTASSLLQTAINCFE